MFRADLGADAAPAAQHGIDLGFAVFNVKCRTSQVIDAVPVIFALIAYAERLADLLFQGFFKDFSRIFQGSRIIQG